MTVVLLRVKQDKHGYHVMDLIRNCVTQKSQCAGKGFNFP